MPPSQNLLLASLSAPDRALLAPHLVPLTLSIRQSLEKPEQTIEDVYFPESGIVSIVAQSPKGDEIEAGIVGREGMTGLAIVMGNHQSPHQCYGQVGGEGLSLNANRLRAAIAASPSLHRHMLLFAQVFMTQISQTALANGRSNITERLARWILMASDRLGSNEVNLTHEFLAVMLGVRRPGVTIALHLLEEQETISAARGVISIVDRRKLEAASRGSYGVTEAHYARLFPTDAPAAAA
ncbi:MAG: Crp/Fnr family transcriptional regulator [Terricaulis sp.]